MYILVQHKIRYLLNLILSISTGIDIPAKKVERALRHPLVILSFASPTKLFMRTSLHRTHLPGLEVEFRKFQIGDQQEIGLSANGPKMPFSK